MPVRTARSDTRGRPRGRPVRPHRADGRGGACQLHGVLAEPDSEITVSVSTRHRLEGAAMALSALGSASGHDLTALLAHLDGPRPA